MYLKVAPEIRRALQGGRPVVALESTIITHGMPYPENLETAISQRGVRKRVKSLWERDFCVKRQGAHFCACFFRHFGHENP